MKSIGRKALAGLLALPFFKTVSVEGVPPILRGRGHTDEHTLSLMLEEKEQKLVAMTEKVERLQHQLLKALDRLEDLEALLEVQHQPHDHGHDHHHGGPVLVFYDDFETFNLSRWQHELTMGGGGNWEFEMYISNRTNSFVNDSVLYIQPTLTADRVGHSEVVGDHPVTVDLWGTQPADQCTGAQWFGCFRQSSPSNILNPVTSARLRTVGTFSFQYGRLEVRAKLPRGDWLWPAIWLLPEHNSYGSWPASGEVDLVESRGNGADYAAGGVNTVGTTLHWGPFPGQDPYEKTHAVYTLPEGKTFADDFHVFGMYWDENGIYSYVDTDDNRVLQVDFNVSFWERGGWANSTFDNPWKGRGKAAPFDQNFYLVMNVACGGVSGYFPDGVGGKPWTNTDADAAGSFYRAKDEWYPTWEQGGSSAMEVDWVKVWQ